MIFLTYEALLNGTFKKVGEKMLVPALPTSIIICARNEMENIQEYCPAWLDQSGIEYEVVIVNDASWDSTEELLDSIQKQDNRLQTTKVTVEQKRPGKKLALTLGIKKARYENFVLTDADCWPKSSDWCHLMSPRPGEDFVLGYGAIKKESGIVNKLARYDTYANAVQYLGLANLGSPYMGVGRNLAYTRALYDGINGFKSYYHIMSGDDDLLVNHHARPKRTRVCYQEEAHTISKAPKGWKDWWNKKRRHLSVSKYYTRRSRWLLHMHNAPLALYYASLIALLTLDGPIWIPVVIHLTKTIIHLLISMRSARILRESDLLPYLLILEPMVLAFNTAAALSAQWRRPRTWK